MAPRWETFQKEVPRFIATGLVASLVAFVLFNWLVHWSPGSDEPWLHGYPLTGYVVANMVSSLLSYRLTRSWAFRHREPVGLAAGRVTYFAINIGSLVIPSACLWVSRHVLDADSALADNLAANVVGLFLGFLARFWAFRVFVFVHPDNKRVLSRL